MKTALVSQDRNPYQVMDILDDELIKAELEHRIVDTWVYSFSSGGTLQTGLSKVGVDACCTEMAKAGNVIREGEVKFQRDPTDPEYILFQGSAKRFAITHEGKEIEMESVNGTKRQWTKMKKKDGKVVDNPFWFETGAMKALRNARARLIPEEIRTKIISLAKQKGKVKDIDGKKTTSTSSKSKTPKARTEAQRKKMYAMTMAKGINTEETSDFLSWLKTKGETIDVDGKEVVTMEAASDIFDNFDAYFSEFSVSILGSEQEDIPMFEEGE
uniref:Uncharacterized protein n=1 Tax=viral metagenome TaxID=1070528 RepID=A0A6M3XZI6_9ZZZZ